ncbi:Interacting inhibitor of differentiation [Astathelohania contejeani]|uniref:Non-structural maintenance of chromosomes element 4 n=1 Tax=Astathelohania contejeani TaxID=164912 RepID=A0ABQ7I295_9MICR|nr:Interacting inhibitor of differentiation [Thelohania contejeani]
MKDSVYQEYLNLIHELKEKREEMVENKNNIFDDLIQRSTELLEKVKTTSELKLDARFSTVSTKISNESMEKVFRESLVTSNDYLEIVQNHFQNGDIRFNLFLKKAAEAFYGIEFVDLFNISDNGEEKDRVKRKKIGIGFEELEVPKVLTEGDLEDNSSIIVNNIRDIVYKFGSLEYYRLVIDPNSFSRTIENIFYLAFAIRNDIVFFEVKNNILYVSKDKRIEPDGQDSHFILNIEHEDYKKIIQKLEIKEALIKHITQ